MKLMSEMSDISLFDVFYGQFTIAVAGGGGGGGGDFHIGPTGYARIWVSIFS